MNEVASRDHRYGGGCPPQAYLLDALVTEIIRLGDRQVTTPVLLVPPDWELRVPFFVALAGGLVRHGRRPVRFDWYQPTDGWFGRVTEWRTQRFVKRLNRMLALLVPSPSAWMEVTDTIGKPTGVGRERIVGYGTVAAELPAWATAVEIFSADRAAA